MKNPLTATDINVFAVWLIDYILHAISQHDELVATLRRVEDASFVLAEDGADNCVGLVPACPICGGHYSHGHIHHKDDCELAALLAEEGSSPV